MSPKDFILRHAAGSWWLVDISQQGMPYRKPMEINETGARIWHMYAKGLGPENIAKIIAEEENLPEADILPDVQNFLKQVWTQTQGAENV
ncbi:MAG: PqqD family protein [Eubacterium sp.]|nr:PqqD family protein [Eubacterium sp.]